MKRDMDLVRSILLKVEDHPEPELDGYLELEGVAGEAIDEHVRLLIDSGFLEAHGPRPFGVTPGYRYLGFSLTWEGHEFIEKIRDPEIWNKTKSGAQKLGVWTVKALGDLAIGYVRLKAAELGLPLQSA